MAIITTTHNYQIELDYIGRYSINDLPSQPSLNAPCYSYIVFNTSWNRTELLGVVENCFNNELNVSISHNTDIAKLVDTLITETKFSTPAANLSGQGLYGFQLTVTDLDACIV
ncbi:hypothetical protein Lepto7375DRAFT_7276 [Leptolyngbya sp. PCC 7375]|nr:hypothetical protein Lepto7375DRAFT_7276 [Leptolyngbya sp. PCC 7375]